MNRTTLRSLQNNHEITEPDSSGAHKAMLASTLLSVFESNSGGSKHSYRNPFERHLNVRATCLLLIVALFTCGCGTSVMPTPVTISYRVSVFELGQVVRITNNSSHHLYNVNVVGRNVQKLSSASVKATDHLSPGETVEVGWLEFESWVPMPGETIEVYADDYLTPNVSFVPNG